MAGERCGDEGLRVASADRGVVVSSRREGEWSHFVNIPL